MLEKLQCQCCGGIIDRQTLTCNSCGMQFRVTNEGQIVFIETSHAKLSTVMGKVVLPREIVVDNTEMAMKMGLSKLAECLTEQIMPLVEFQQEYDPCRMEYVLHGSIRVAEPNTVGQPFRYYQLNR